MFEFSRSQETWQDARDYCQRIGGDLLKIDNYEEDEYIKTLLKTESSKSCVYVHLGCVYSKYSSFFHWVRVTFHEWVNLNNVSVISMQSKTTSVVQLLAWSLRLWYIVGSSPGRVEPKIIKLESAVSPLSTQH